MNNNFKKIMCLTLVLLSFVFILNTNAVVFAQTNSEDEKVYCNATLDDDFSDNEILVVLNKQVSRQLQSTVSFGEVDCLSVEDLTSSYDTEEEMNENFRRIYKITLRNSGKEKVLENIRKLEKISYVYSAEPNYYLKMQVDSSSVQVNPNDDLSPRQYAIDSMNLNEAWNFSTGSNDVTVGIIDTGIDGSHPDLKANINTELSKNYFVDSSDQLIDIDGHGTHIAGIIGANGNNSFGVKGVNWNVSLVSYRVATLVHSFLFENIFRAFDDANRANIDILNFSAGSSEYDIRYEKMKQAIISFGGLFVCSAGNDKKNTDISTHYPSCFDLPNLISVGALNCDDDRRFDSNYGANTVQIFAPGDAILSTVPTTVDSDGYDSIGGTSMATPQVAGAAALLLSINPNLTAAQLKSAILNGAGSTTITLPDGTTQNVKKLDAFGAVKQVMSGASTGWLLNFNEHNLSQNVGEGSYFVDNNVMIKLVVRGAGNYKFSMSSTEPLNVTLYDSNLNATDITPTYSNGNCTINLSQDLAFGTYYLRVNFADDADSGVINVTIPAHTHIYDDWQYYSHSSHISACKCGRTAFEKAPHTIRTSDIVNFHAPCLGCHYLLDLREDVAISPYGSGLKVSVNGSYICPSGIVVLVDEDVDAYFAGTLRFYDQDQLPQLG